MSSQGRRLRRKPKYNHGFDNAIAACVHSLAWQFHCSVIEGDEITLRHKGRSMKLGTVDDVKAMTLRGLIGRFEEITQLWRAEMGLYD